MKKTIYLAQPMGGRVWGEVVDEASAAKSKVESFGFRAWCPPLKEGVYTNEWDVITTPPTILKSYWKQDVTALKKSDAVISLRGDLASEGVGFELAMAKYRFQIPIVVVSKYDVGRVSHLESDYVAGYLDEACEWLWQLFQRRANRRAARKKK